MVIVLHNNVRVRLSICWLLPL